MEQFEITLIFIIYFIGIAITYAIFEDPEDKSPFTAAPLVATLWPVMLLYCVYVILVYPFYRITKKIKNKLKH